VEHLDVWRSRARIDPVEYRLGKEDVKQCEQLLEKAQTLLIPKTHSPVPPVALVNLQTEKSFGMRVANDGRCLF
jgi:hypothetical protein